MYYIQRPIISIMLTTNDLTQAPSGNFNFKKAQGYREIHLAPRGDPVERLKIPFKLTFSKTSYI